MAEQTIVIDGAKIRVDVDKLSDEEASTLERMIAGSVETRPGMPKAALPMALGGSKAMNARDQIDASDPNALKAEKLTGTKLMQMLAGGAIGGVTGGPVGLGLGLASPPTTLGEGLGMLGGGVAGKVLGPLAQGLKGIKGVVGAGAAGLAENGVQQLGEKAGQLITGDPSQGNPHMGMNTAISAIAPAAVSGLLKDPARKVRDISAAGDALQTNAKSVLSKIMGREVSDPSTLRTAVDAVTPQSNKPGKSLLSPLGRVYGTLVNKQAQALDNQRKIVDESRTYYNQLVDTAQQGKQKVLSLTNTFNQGKRATKAALGSANTQLDDMQREAEAPFINRAVEALYMSPEEMTANMAKHADDTVSDMATAVEKRASVFAGRRQQANLKNGQPVGEGPLALSAPDPYSQENLQRQIEDTKLKMVQDFQAADKYKRDIHGPLEKSLAKSPEVDPNLKVFLNSKVNNVDDFQKALDGANPTNIVVLRKSLTGPDPEKVTPQVKAFEESFARRFSQMALGPDGTLSNVAEANKAYTHDKIQAIYGGGQRGREKAEMFQKLVDRTQNLMADQAKDPSGLKLLDVKNIGSIPYVIVKGAMTKLDPLAAIGRGLAGAGVTAMAVNYPKMLDYMINHPKLGSQFEEWIATKSVDSTLKYYPLVEKYFKENNEHTGPKKKAQ